MTDSLIPARATPPGVALKNELDERGWTQNDLAEIMGRPPQAISEIIRGTKQITPETALELAEAIGTSAELWSNLEANYRLEVARKKEKMGRKDDSILRKSRLYQCAPITELIKRGWIKGASIIDDLEKEVMTFLEIESLDDIPRVPIANFRQTIERGPEIVAQVAWLKRVEQLAKLQQSGNFDKGRLQSAIPEFMVWTKKPEDIKLIPSKLLDLGVHFVIVPHLPKTFTDGVTFKLENKPVIALTLRYDRIDHFWFTLLHELAHIILEHDSNHIDSFEKGAKNAINEEEAAANQQAGEWLLDATTFDRFVRETEPFFSQLKIEQFAKKTDRHPGIILGRLQHQDKVGFAHLRTLLVKVNPYLKEWVDVPYPTA